MKSRHFKALQSVVLTAQKLQPAKISENVFVFDFADQDAPHVIREDIYRLQQDI